MAPSVTQMSSRGVTPSRSRHAAVTSSSPSAPLRLPVARPVLRPASLGRRSTIKPVCTAPGAGCGLPAPLFASVSGSGHHAAGRDVMANASGGGPTVAAATTVGEDSGSDGNSQLIQTLLLGGLFGLWYLFNIWFNIYNKQVLKVFAYPITCTNLQFVVGTVIALTMWTLRLHKPPKLDKGTLMMILPLAAVHTLGNLLTNVSLGQVAVSFTHTIKAMEPFFSVALSAMFLGDVPSVPVLLTLLPIVGGVACASLSEPTFNWMGFSAAMGSNLTFQSRNVLSKKFMGGKKKPMDNINLFSVITIMSMFLLMPVTYLTEGIALTSQNMAAIGIQYPGLILQKALIAGVCFHCYQQVSYMILQRVSPVTHSIGNCVKRVIVIVASVLILGNAMTTQSAAGTAIALLGVFAYSQAKRMETKNKQAKEA